ncbi:MAG: preprotein translocase subunit SecE [Clostridia bacterium]|nr:preprotein translocase subunit SecE [Clostridia bacterium]MBQ6624912.1 preprotein translocase subunit SecE [Clostridia bacterium]
MSKKEKSEAAEKVAKAEKVTKAKSAKANKAGKPNIFARMGKGIVRFCKDFKGEIKKIQWPGGKEILKSSMVVILTVVFIGVCIFAIDWLLSEGLKLLMRVADKSYGSKEAATEAFIAFKNLF